MTQTDLDKAQELKRLASDWVERTFNHVPLATLEKLTDKQLYEYITPEALSEFRADWWDGLEDDNKADILEEFNPGRYTQMPLNNPLKVEAFCEWLDENKEQEMREWRDESGHEEYPMWGTCFEFKYSTSEEIKSAAQAAGFGLIEGGERDLEDYNTILWVGGCGYSFYGQHWIPLFLSLPWNEKLREEYAGVEFGMM